MQVQVACPGYESSTGGKVRLGEKAANKGYLCKPAAIGGERDLLSHGKLWKSV